MVALGADPRTEEVPAPVQANRLAHGAVDDHHERRTAVPSPDRGA